MPDSGSNPPAEQGDTERHLANAAAHADMGTTLPEGTRRRTLKRLLLRLLRLVTTEQAAFNDDVLDAVRSLSARTDHLKEITDAEIASVRSLLDHSSTAVREELQRLSTAIDSLSALLTAETSELNAAIDREGQERADAEQRIVEGAVAVGELRAQLLVQRSRVELFLREARKRLPEPLDHDDLATIAAETREGHNELLSDLSKPFRGSFDEITDRMAVHVDLVSHLRNPKLPVLDLGAGRGEWLTLLAAQGTPAYGVDTNAEVVRDANDRGLDVRLDNAADHLAGLPEGSLGAVTAFHVIEHLDFDEQVHILDAALHALAPGGLILLETPNPANLTVGAYSFHLDPTHRVPVPAQLLQFLVEQRGYVDVTVRYLHPMTEDRLRISGAEEVASLKPVLDRLNELLFGPQDYAVSAWKPPGAPRTDHTEA